MPKIHIKRQISLHKTNRGVKPIRFGIDPGTQSHAAGITH